VTKCFHCGGPADLELRTSFKAISLRGARALKEKPTLEKTPMPVCMGCLVAMGTMVEDTMKDPP
jgi:hypothetical protein